MNTNTTTTIEIEELKNLLEQRIKEAQTAMVHHAAIAQSAGFNLRVKEDAQHLAEYHRAQQLAYQDIRARLNLG